MKFVALCVWFFGTAAWAADPAVPGSQPADSLPAFRADSTKMAAVHALESGSPNRPNRGQSNQGALDSLSAKLRHRRPFFGVMAAISFADHSAKDLFSAHVDTLVARDSLHILQPYDPVHISFPLGLVAGIPVFTYLDLWVRSEDFWYQQSALAQGLGPAQEFWYAVQAHLFGVGARYLVPLSLLSVADHPGLYLAYTQFWNYGATEMYAPTGEVRAKINPLGCGYEIQAGFQQDFDKRWAMTGGLAFANLDFESGSSWKAILPYGPDASAHWAIHSLRLQIQALYQFGAHKTQMPTSPTRVAPIPPAPMVPAQK